MIKAIETKYKGYRFRSRLEARWAVFFDHVKIPWEYEKEGFEIDGTKYLPDFYLPSLEVYAEVKPEQLSQEEFRKIAALRGLVLDGLPKERGYILAGEACQCTVEIEMNELSYSPTTYCYDCYLKGECYWSIDIVRSHHKRQHWYLFSNDNSEVFTDGSLSDAVEATKSARFEFEESGA